MKKVSYCSQICNRLWQAAITLPRNISQLKNDEELILLDYGSTDKLEQYVQNSPECNIAMSEGKFSYIKVLNTEGYQCPKAKNLSHRMANGEIVVNLDIDNYLEGFRDVIDRNFIGTRKLLLHMETRRFDGSYGRIAFRKQDFELLGGYNEELQESAYQDTDIIERAKRKNISYIYEPVFTVPIKNSMKEKGENTNTKDWRGLKSRNKKISENGIKAGHFVANKFLGWGAADVIINFTKKQKLEKIFP
jgi:hypothetical protein